MQVRDFSSKLSHSLSLPLYIFMYVYIHTHHACNHIKHNPWHQNNIKHNITRLELIDITQSSKKIQNMKLRKMMATSAENPGATKNRLLRSKNTAAINTVSGAPTTLNSYRDHSLRVLRRRSPKCTRKKKLRSKRSNLTSAWKTGTHSVSHQNEYPKNCKKWYPRSERDEQLGGCASGTRSGRSERLAVIRVADPQIP